MKINHLVAFLLLANNINVANGLTIDQTPVVICPGFGNDQIDYYEPLQQPREVGLVSALERRGFNSELISTVPIQRSDWFRVAGGLLDFNFYTNSAKPTGNGYGWYIQRLKHTVDEAYAKSNGQSVLLLGHSAGGWLARAAMGDGVWCAENQIRTAERIKCLATVGAIHRPPTDVSSCVTRGALAYTNVNYPGAFLKEEGVGYVSIGGDAILGNNEKVVTTQQQEAESATDADNLYASRGEGSAQRVAYTSYESVCGEGIVSGDGVVPLDWTQLEGSRQIQLEGVLHSINEAGTTIPTDRWYGSENVIDRWLPAVLEEAGINAKKGDKFALDGIQKWAQELLQSR